MTAQGGKKVSRAAHEAGALVGFETSHNPPPEDVPVNFCDFPFTDPSATFEDHLEAVRRHEPAIAVAPDVERGRRLSEVLDAADALSRHAQTVVIVPKSVHPREVPDRYRVGLPLADFGSGAPWTVWDYTGHGPVHLLGGPPSRQLTVRQHLRVASVDTASPIKAATFGSVWNGAGWDERPDLDMYERVEASYRAMHRGEQVSPYSL